MPTFASSMIHWEDLDVGTPRAYGTYEVTKEEIFAYARAYDPQPHHVDEEAAKLSLTKGLCASGWHSCAMFMRIFYDGGHRTARIWRLHRPCGRVAGRICQRNV